jgi:hypothetical protein
MGFLKFLKKALESSTKIEEETLVEKISYKYLRNWIQKQKSEIAEKENEFLKKINERTSQLAIELGKEVTALQQVDLDDLKVEKRAKLITKININKYIEHLRNLAETLQCLEVDTSNNLMETITEIFETFEQKSTKNFQKAAFLAGHKLNNIGVSTGRFFKDIRQIMNDNNILIDRVKIVRSVDLKLNDIDNLKKTQLAFKSKVTCFEQKIVELKAKEHGINTKIQVVKTSKSYAEELKKQKDLEKNTFELKEKFHKLKTLIDFKFLANTFHSNPKQLAIVREYKVNFEEAFQRDSGEKFTHLLKEAEVSQSTIFHSIDEIVDLKQKIESIMIKTDQVEDLSKDIKKIKLQIEDMTSKKELEQKRYSKFQAGQEKIFNSIRDKLSKINVELE